MLQSSVSAFFRVVTNYPYLVILCVLALVAATSPYIKKLDIDSSADSLMLESDPDLKYYREVHRHYSTDEFLIVGYKPHGEMLSQETILLIDGLVQKFENLDRVEAVTSITNVPLLMQPIKDEKTGSIEYPNLMSPEVDINKAREEFTTSSIYLDNLVNRNLGLTAIHVGFYKNQALWDLQEQRYALLQKQDDGSITKVEEGQLESIRADIREQRDLSNDHYRQVLTSMRADLSELRDAGQFYLAGAPLVNNDMKDFVRQDLATFGVAIAAIMVIVLLIFFRSLAWVFLALVCAVLSVLLVSGLIGLMDYQLTVISSNFVALLLIFSIALSIHVIIRYQEIQSLNPDASTKENTRTAASQIITPCLYMVLTTVIAFFSLTVSDIRPIITFGHIMILGLFCAFLLTFTVLPALITLFEPRPRQLQKDTSSVLLNRVLNLVLGNKMTAAVVLTSMFLFGLVGIGQLTVENRFIDYFKKSTDIYQGLAVIDQELGGISPLEVILDATRETEPEIDLGEEDDEFAEFDDYLAGLEDTQDDFTATSYWYNRFGIRKIDKIHKYLEGLPEIGKVLSLSSIEEVMRLVNDGEELEDFHLSMIYSKVPENVKQAMIAPYVSADGNQARILARIRDSDPSLVRNDLLNKIRADIGGNLVKDNEEFRLTGISVLYNNVLQSLFRSQILTLGTVFACILVVLAFLFRSLKLALIGALPNMFTVLFVLGLIGMSGIPLDIMTITTAAITVGVGVDYAIHYIHRYKRERARKASNLDAIRTAQTTAGKALYFTSITISLGFVILVLSSFFPSIYFGMLTSIAMLISLFATFSVIPLLLETTAPAGSHEELVRT
ncbi:MAG: MMPL family transporter [Gammaproteobacteria bacterium]|nr:MMPL family transporter [Gammaproteobacteria bacterium]